MTRLVPVTHAAGLLEQRRCNTPTSLMSRIATRARWSSPYVPRPGHPRRRGTNGDLATALGLRSETWGLVSVAALMLEQPGGVCDRDKPGHGDGGDGGVNSGIFRSPPTSWPGLVPATHAGEAHTATTTALGLRSET